VTDLAAELYFAGRLAFAGRPDVRLCTRDGRVTRTRRVEIPGARAGGYGAEGLATRCVMLIASARAETVSVGLIAEEGGDPPEAVARSLLAELDAAEARDDERLRRAGLAGWISGGEESGWSDPGTIDFVRGRRRVAYYGAE
jgi:hypothetical protein